MQPVYFLLYIKPLWTRQDSNLRPSDYESPALTAAPRTRYKHFKCFSVQCHIDTSNVTLKHLRWRAGDGIRTHEYQLGRLMPYHLATPARIILNMIESKP